MQQTFVPDFEVVSNFNGLASVKDISEEVGVYSASPDFVRSHCGPLALSILDTVPEDFYRRCERQGMYPNIDIRVHRLYPGDFPAVPGWHADGEFRENYHSQPDITKFVQHDHLVGSISTDANGVSLTEVVASPLTTTIENPSSDRTLWSQVHDQVESSDVEKLSLPDGQLTQMGAFTLHRATAARVRGWRLFFRLSMWHKPYLSEDGGCISRQEQVYRLSEAKGW